MLNKEEHRNDIVVDLIERLSDIAPVYASLGNHEVEYMKLYDDLLIEKMEQAGAIVLDKEYVDIDINGLPVRIAGIYGYVNKPNDKNHIETEFMKDFQDTSRFKILLSHLSEGLLLWNGLNYWNVDLVFSGHIHGGQIRIPFIGGLYSPEEGYFPKYTKGKYDLKNGSIILSSGLGSSGFIPRINNLLEVVVCNIE